MARRMRHRKVRRTHSRKFQSRPVVRATGMATTMGVGGLVMAVMGPHTTASADSSDLQSAIDQVIAAQQQIVSTDTADFPTASTADPAQLGAYAQGEALQMLTYQLDQLNDIQNNPLDPYLPANPYMFNAPLADARSIDGLQPDTKYDFLPIAPNETYDITVTPGPGTEDASFTPETGASLSNQINPTNLPGALDLLNATPNADGTYTIVLSPTEQAGNWVDTAGADEVLIRNTFGAWGATPDQFSIQADPLSSPSDISSMLMPQLSDTQISSMLSDIATDLPANNTSSFPFLDVFDVKLPANVFTPIQLTSSLGVGGTLLGQLASYGNFTVEPGQAVIIEVPNITAAYTGFQAVDGFGESLPYATVEGSLNNTQVFADPDGDTYYVMSDTDPGVANWIDTSGVTDGGVLLRWQNATEAAPSTHITTEVVPVADVSQYLPADTPTVTPAEYATIDQERLFGYDYELDQSKDMGWVTQNLELDQIKAAMGTAEFNQVFGSQVDVPSVLDRLVNPADIPNLITAGQDILTDPSASLSAIMDNLPLAANDIELPTVLAAVGLEQDVAQTIQVVSNDISSDQPSQVLTDLGTGVQGLEMWFNETFTDPSTSITAGILNARDDLAVAIATANGSQLDALSSELGQTSSTAMAELSTLLDPATMASELSALFNPADIASLF